MIICAIMDTREEVEIAYQDCPHDSEGYKMCKPLILEGKWAFVCNEKGAGIEYAQTLPGDVYYFDTYWCKLSTHAAILPCHPEHRLLTKIVLGS